MDKTKKPNILSFIATTVFVIIALTYVFIAFSTEDTLWFISTFEEEPREVFINCYGEEILFHPGTPEFDSIVTTVNAVLSEDKNWDSLSMSAETYSAYKIDSKMLVMELRYPKPVRVHSYYKYFSNLNTIVIPLDGRHASAHAIFGTINNIPSAGSLHYDRIPDIRTHIESEGICTTP